MNVPSTTASSVSCKKSSSGFWILLRSRRLFLMMAIAVVLELSMPFWASRAFKVTNSGASVMATPVATGMQFAVVAVLAYTVSSSFSGMDRQASRWMRLYQLLFWFILAVPVFIALLVCTYIMFDLLPLSTEEGHRGNMGAWVMVKAFVGLWGVGLITTTLMDRRLVGIVPAVVIILPISLDMGTVALPSVWGFVGRPDSDGVAWITALVLLVMGIVLHMFWVGRRWR